MFGHSCRLHKIASVRSHVEVPMLWYWAGKNIAGLCWIECGAI